MQEARRRQKELEQVERQNAAAAVASPGPQATPQFAVPAARPHSAHSARFAEGVLHTHRTTQFTAITHVLKFVHLWCTCLQPTAVAECIH